VIYRGRLGLASHIITFYSLPFTLDKLAMEAPEKAKKNRDKKEIEKERVKIFVE